MQPFEHPETAVVAVDSPAAEEHSPFHSIPSDVTEFDQTDDLHVPRVPNPLRHPLRCIWWFVRSLFGVATLVVLLAILAAIPIASLFVLGCLLEVEARVARTGKLRFAFPLLHIAPRIGSAGLGVALWLLPLWLIAGIQADAQLIDPGGSTAAGWQTAKLIAVPLVACHLCLALARGGTFGCFFRPLKNLRWLLAELRNKPLKNRIRCRHCGESLSQDAQFCTLCHRYAERDDDESEATIGPADESTNTYWRRADRKLQRFLHDLRFQHHFLLGWRGFAAAFVVLILPTVFYAAATRTEPLPLLVTVFGGICLAAAFLYVPFLQARVAVENRFSAVKDFGEVRRLFCYAPIAWFVALLLTYALALPLYLFTIFAAPQDVLWLITVVFLVTIYPARVAVGWAYGRALRKEREGRNPAWWGFRWSCRLLMLAATVAFTFVFFFTRDISSRGRLVLFEHHAFFGTVLSSIFSALPFPGSHAAFHLFAENGVRLF